MMRTPLSNAVPIGALVGELRVATEGMEGEVEEKWLDRVQVDPSMRQRGIGAEMIRLAIQHADLSHVPGVKHHKSYAYCLSEPGQRLVARCIEGGIIPIEMCYFSSARADESPYSSSLMHADEHGQLADDPQFDSPIVQQAIVNRAAGVTS